MENFLKTLVDDFSEEEVNAMVSKGVPKTAKAGTILFYADGVFNKFWFLEEGMIRAYRIVNGEDYTYFFFSPNGFRFTLDYESYLTGAKSPFFFEALTDVKYLEFSKKQSYKLYQEHPKFEMLGRLLAESAYLLAAKRLKKQQVESPETRYLALLENDEDLFQKVPQYHIASYLGIKPQSLSRIKARLLGKTY